MSAAPGGRIMWLENTPAPAPGTPEWACVVSASKLAGVLGLSPYASPRSTWHLLRGEVPPDDGRNADVKSRGHYLESGVLEWWRDQHPEFQYSVPQYVARRDDLPWALATPDLAVWTDAPIYGTDDRPEHLPVAIVDAKTARDDDEWGRPGTDEIPAYYAAQLMWGMHLSGARVAYIALLTNRLDLREYVLHYDQQTGHNLERIAAEFWRSTLTDTPPPLDDHPATFQTMRRVHPDVNRDEAVQLDYTDAIDLVEAKAATKRAEAAERLARSRVLEAMGSARYALHGTQTIARRQGSKHGASLVVTATTVNPKEPAA